MGPSPHLGAFTVGNVWVFVLVFSRGLVWWASITKAAAMKQKSNTTVRSLSLDWWVSQKWVSDMADAYGLETIKKWGYIETVKRSQEDARATKT